ncbi:uncharacterized protein N0V89_009072 [Didymosphaeria variabile]|uniref:Uncharacterized protein n=1 Tax=Didymosphaeria variabile TaxID=1932322 RepID=A0A9W9C960_9PLEO|nr:uncharacterized protein N0V89_009072 [Didymosphaeria variabile]KAJ4350451.1 hypothetical protein N0V89_009072 [Didymosphaeria variabile]
MASWPPGLRIGAEPSAALSHPITPNTSDPFFLHDADFDHDLGKEELDYSRAKVLEAMSSGVRIQLDDPLPVFLRFTDSGRVENGLYPPEFYEYADDLRTPCTWKECRDAIDSFEWGGPTLGLQQEQVKAYGEEQLLTPAVEDSQADTLLSDAASQTLPHSASPRVDNTEAELAVDEGFIHAGPTTGALISESSPRSLHRAELAVPTLPFPADPTPLEASEDRIESSTPRIEGPPPKAVVAPGVIISTRSLEAADSRDPIAYQSVSSPLLGDAVEADSMLPRETSAEKASGVKDIQGTIEGDAKLLVQSAVPEEESISLPHIADRAATPSNTAVAQLYVDRPIEGQMPNDEGTLGEVQPQTNTAADETDVNDLGSLFDCNGEEPGQIEQQHGQDTDAIHPRTETAEPVDIPAQASPANTHIAANSSTEIISTDTPIQPSLHDEVAAQILEHFNSMDQESPSGTLSEEHTSELQNSTEVLALPSTLAVSATEYGSKASDEAEVDAESVGGPAANEVLLVESVQDEAPSSPPEVDPQLLQHNVAEQGMSTDVGLTGDINISDENHKVDADSTGGSTANESSLVESLQDKSPSDPPGVDPQLLQPGLLEQRLFTGVGLAEDVNMSGRNDEVDGDSIAGFAAEGSSLVPSLRDEMPSSPTKVDPELPQHDVPEQGASTEVWLTQDVNISAKHDKVDVDVQIGSNIALQDIPPVPFFQNKSLSMTPSSEVEAPQQKSFEQESCSETIKAEHYHMGVQGDEMDLAVGSNSGSTSKHADEWPSSPDEPELSDPPKDTQLPQQKNLKQALLSSEGMETPKDNHDADEIGPMTKSEEVEVSGEEIRASNSPERKKQRSPFTLKIKSQIWNVAPRDGANDDASAVEDTAMASIPTSGNAIAELQEPDDMVDFSETESSDGSGSSADLSPPEKTPSRPSVSVEESPSLPSLPLEDGTLADSEERTPQPLLLGLEEHAAAASSSTIAPSIPTAMNIPQHDQSSPWAGTMLEQQLDLPPSPYESEPATRALPVETCDPESDASLGANASIKVGLQAAPADAHLPVPKQDTPRETPEPRSVPANDESTVSSDLSDLNELIETKFGQSTPKSVPRKRTRPATTEKARAIPDATVEYEPEESSGSDYEAPTRKKQKNVAFQTSSSASRSKGKTKLPAPSKGRRGKKATQQVLEEEVVDREDTESSTDDEEEQTTSTQNGASPAANETSPNRPVYWALETNYGKRVTRGDAHNGRVGNPANTTPVQGAVQTVDEEEILVDAEPDGTIDSISKAKGKDKAATPAKVPKTPNTAVKTTPRTTRAKTSARAAGLKTPNAGPSNTSEAATKRGKFGFKMPNGRKRKATEAADEPMQPSSASSGQAYTQRQTRQASAAQEEQQRQMEMETNVAKRTRGARRSLP